MVKASCTTFPALPQAGGSAFPLFEPPAPAGAEANSQAPRPPATSPPDVQQLSPQGQARAATFAVLFLRDLLCAHDQSGQPSETRARYGVNGSNAIGIAVRTLKQRGIIHSLGYTASTGPRRRGGTEQIWAVADEEKARRWLAARGVTVERPAPSEAAKPSKAEPADTYAHCPDDERGQSTDTPQTEGAA